MAVEAIRSPASVTCKEIHEQITAFVDNRVDEGEYRKKVEQHISYCPDCRAAYELELMTKMIVRDRSPRQAAPDELRKAIAGGMEKIALEWKVEQGRGDAASEHWLDRFSARYLSPAGMAIALLFVVIGGFFLFRASGGSGERDIAVGEEERVVEPQSTSPQNFFNKASDNFAAILAGQLGLEKQTSNPQELEQYFRQEGIAYPVVFRPVRAPLAGGVISEHGPTKFAHVVYMSGDTILYFFEVPHDALAQGKVVYVTPDRLEHLDRGEWIWEEPSSGTVLGMYRDGDVVCAVVGNVDRAGMERLLAIH